MASTYLTRTNSGTGSTTAATLSMWVKFSNISTDQALWENYSGSGNYLRLRYRSDASLAIQVDLSNSTDVQKITTRKFRDTNAWYHIVLAINLSDSTQEDKYILYVNGVRETSFSTNNNTANTSGNYVGGGNGFNFTIGRHPSDDAYLKGVMSHVHFVDGSALAPTVFGSTDATTGEWKINTSPSITMGTNGFTILKDGNTITDQSSNSNDFTLGGGTLTKTEDCPSNVFCCLNPLEKQGSTLSNGNTTSAYGSGTWKGVASTLAIETGKFYYEAKLVSGSSGQLGIIRADNFPSNIGASNGLETNALGNITGALGVNFADGSVQAAGGSGGTAQGFTVSAGDIVGCAVDGTNNKIYWSKNGVWGNSSNPVDGTNATTIASNLTDYKPLIPAISVNNSTISTNFGNGYFGTTAVSSAGTNASGNGVFEYDVPTGYTALSTKGLNL